MNHITAKMISANPIAFLGTESRMALVLLVAGAIGMSGSVSASAQGLDDLFERPNDVGFNLPADEEPLGSNNSLRGPAEDRMPPPRPPQQRRVDRIPDRIPASDMDSQPVASPSDMKLVDRRSGSGSRNPLEMTAMEIRQARSLAETRARTARLEAARWSGSATLRPSWNPDPMTSSRFPAHHVMRVPVYVRRR